MHPSASFPGQLEIYESMYGTLKIVVNFDLINSYQKATHPTKKIGSFFFKNLWNIIDMFMYLATKSLSFLRV